MSSVSEAQRGGLEDLTRAAIVGTGAGLRAFAAPAVLAARGTGPLAGAARFIAYGAAAGELVADKQPDMSSRWATRGLMLRVGFSSAAGHQLAGIGGAATAAAAALVGARCGFRLRSMTEQSAAAVAIAIAEDAASYALVAWATGDLPRR